MPLVMHYLRNTNPYWMLVGAAFSAFGGGVPVAFNMLYAIAADVADEKNRWANYTLRPLQGPLLFTHATSYLTGCPEARAS